MNDIPEDLKHLVISEATKLRFEATVDELDKLCVLWISPRLNNKCIYGMMTGDCFSKRATALLNLCAIPYSKYLKSGSDDPCYPPDHKRFMPDQYRNFSPIEVYITLNGAQVETLVKFIKGEKETLKVSEL